jgi:hypothetical protein
MTSAQEVAKSVLLELLSMDGVKGGELIIEGIDTLTNHQATIVVDYMKEAYELYTMEEAAELCVPERMEE